MAAGEAPGTSAEHSYVKLKRLGMSEFNQPEIGMRGIHQNVPFATDSGGRDQQAYCAASADPLVPEAMQRLIPAGRFATTALAVHAIGDAAEDVLHHSRTHVGIQLIEGPFTT